MAERKNIALFFSYDENWIGGTYYILSLIHSLQVLPDAEKPSLIIICNSDEDFFMVKNTNYPYLVKHLVSSVDLQLHQPFLYRVINKITLKINGQKLIEKRLRLHFKGAVQAIFPCPQMNTFIDVKKTLFWIPDFQEYYLPHLYKNNEDERLWKYNFGAYLSQHNHTLILSSLDALNDFNTIYPKNRTLTTVVPFAVTHPPYAHLDILELKTKYNIIHPYFFSPNQFWEHKNHTTVIDAALKLRDAGFHNFHLVFSGKETDFRNPDYAKNLKKKVVEYGLQEQILFLGFIDRAEQLQLMNYAIGIIQPSLFEGWSTVIEDAKSMHQNIIASDLNVHKEQLIHYGGILFNRTDSTDLSVILSRYLTSPPAKVDYDYDKDKLLFARKFIQATC